jgi:hypothetical protein
MDRFVNTAGIEVLTESIHNLLHIFTGRFTLPFESPSSTHADELPRERQNFLNSLYADKAMKRSSFKPLIF